jgi:hypothetical protein
MCGACGSDRIWQDVKGEKHCWECEPPAAVIRRWKKQAQQRKADARTQDFEVQRAIEDEARDGAFIPKHWS